MKRPRLTASANPRRTLRSFYIILTVNGLYLAAEAYGHWWELIAWFAVAVYLAALARAEHRALKAWPTKAAVYLFVCRDCLETVARITLPTNAPPPDRHEVHNGSPIPFKPDTLHHCTDGGVSVHITTEVKK